VAKGADASLPSYAQHSPHGHRRGGAGGLLALTLTDGKRGGRRPETAGCGPERVGRETGKDKGRERGLSAMRRNSGSECMVEGTRGMEWGGTQGITEREIKRGGKGGGREGDGVMGGVRDHFPSCAQSAWRRSTLRC
jgi:hypothetical protein